MVSHSSEVKKGVWVYLKVRRGSKDGVIKTRWRKERIQTEKKICGHCYVIVSCISPSYSPVVVVLLEPCPHLSFLLTAYKVKHLKERAHKMYLDVQAKQEGEMWWDYLSNATTCWEILSSFFFSERLKLVVKEQVGEDRREGCFNASRNSQIFLLLSSSRGCPPNSFANHSCLF